MCHSFIVDREDLTSDPWEWEYLDGLRLDPSYEGNKAPHIQMALLELKRDLTGYKAFIGE